MLTNKYFNVGWEVPSRVKALITTKNGGYEDDNYGNFNLAYHVGDDENNVTHNRELLCLDLPGRPHWLNQVHSNLILDLDTLGGNIIIPSYDAEFTRKINTVCTVMTADCLPILLTDINAGFVAAVHAGWRGLHTNILAQSFNTINNIGKNTIAYIGPAICAKHYEVGSEVLDLFVREDQEYAQYFSPTQLNKFECDLVGIANYQLQRLGVPQHQIYLSRSCTYCNHELFYSYRRQNKTGRFASLIWLADDTV